MQFVGMIRLKKMIRFNEGGKTFFSNRCHFDFTSEFFYEKLDPLEILNKFASFDFENAMSWHVSQC